MTHLSSDPPPSSSTTDRNSTVTRSPLLPDPRLVPNFSPALDDSPAATTQDRLVTPVSTLLVPPRPHLAPRPQGKTCTTPALQTPVDGPDDSGLRVPHRARPLDSPSGRPCRGRRSTGPSLGYSVVGSTSSENKGSIRGWLVIQGPWDDRGHTQGRGSGSVSESPLNFTIPHAVREGRVSFLIVM